MTVARYAREDETEPEPAEAAAEAPASVVVEPPSPPPMAKSLEPVEPPAAEGPRPIVMELEIPVYGQSDPPVTNNRVNNI